MSFFHVRPVLEALPVALPLVLRRELVALQEQLADPRGAVATAEELSPNKGLVPIEPRFQVVDNALDWAHHVCWSDGVWERRGEGLLALRRLRFFVFCRDSDLDDDYVVPLINTGRTGHPVFG